MTKLVTIYGGSGFVGRYIAQRMAREGWRVRVAVRRPNEAMSVKPYGAVGQVEPVFCNVRDDQSVSEVMSGANAVINCVGLLAEKGRNSFEGVHVEGAGRIARLARESNVEQLVHISAIGANEIGNSEYARTKGLGEKAVLLQFPKAIILRPSVIFGTEDKFFNKFATMTAYTPILPIVGGNTRMQPVYADDVAQAAVQGALGRARPGVYELGGPGVHSLREMIQMMLDVIERRRLVLNMPFGIGRVIGWGFDMAQMISLGLFTNTILTRDQVKSLAHDNVVSDDALGFENLGIKPMALDAVLPEYLWVYRPSGQFSAIKNSAKNLKA